MPYRHAQYFLVFVLLTIVVGFWGTYWRPITDVPLAFHVHAFTATTWVLLLMLQHWSIHGRRRRLHRLVGTASLALFPFLIVGFVMIINVAAGRFVAADDASARFLAPSFGLSMIFAVLAYLVLYVQGLRHRRSVRLHAGYMLTTALVLFESPFSRILLEHLPFLVFTSSDFPQRILDAIVLAMAMAIAFSLVMYLRDRRGGVPFLVAAVLMILQAVTMYYGTYSETFRAVFAWYATLPAGWTIGTGFALGVIAAWVGWSMPKAGTPRRVPSRAAA
ncbi:hypothetical protein [Halomonas denitrificans]|nr:hypothetical protein [Halomonas denitrificans]